MNIVGRGDRHYGNEFESLLNVKNYTSSLGKLQVADDDSSGQQVPEGPGAQAWEVLVEALMEDSVVI